VPDARAAGLPLAGAGASDGAPDNGAPADGAVCRATEKRKRAASPIDNIIVEHNGRFSFHFEGRRQSTVVSIYFDEAFRGHLSYSPSDYDNTVDILHVHIVGLPKSGHRNGAVWLSQKGEVAWNVHSHQQSGTERADVLL
jgi:hypothetical protein